MRNSNTTILILCCLVIFLLPSCLPGGGAQPPSDEASANAIATSVAATLAAGEAGQSAPDTAAPPPSPTWTIHPTVTASPPEANFRYAGVSFYFSDLLADDITAGVTPGEYDEYNPAWSFPEHREYLFNGWVLSDAFHEARIRIYPVAEYKALSDFSAERLDSLDAALTADPLDVSGLAVPSFFNAAQFYSSNAREMRFQNGYGARWLSQYGQAFATIGWPNLFYTFQGFTDDGNYYVSVIFPVDHPALLEPDDVELDEDFAEGFLEYTENTRQAMEMEPDNSFVPSLTLMDQLVASLTVGEP